jgi:hypothetical protein
MSLKGTLGGWIGAVAQLLFAPLENAFPPLAAIGGSIISGFSKEEAGLILGECRAFTQRLADGQGFEDAFTATLNELGTGELKILSDEAKSFVHMFAHKSKKG